MKHSVVVFFIFLLSVSVYSQDHQSKNNFLFSGSFGTNISNAKRAGVAVKISGGYVLFENFSLLLTTGYMTSYSNAKTINTERSFDYNSDQYIVTLQHREERQFKFIPIDLSLRFSFPISSISAYAVVKGGYDFMIDNGNYNVVVEKRYESSNELIEQQSSNASDFYKESDSDWNLGLGCGILIPIMKATSVNIYYQVQDNSLYPTIHSIGAGISYEL